MVSADLLSFLACTFLAVPFYFLWNHLAPIYFCFLPTAYIHLSFWDCVWLFMVLSIIKAVIFPYRFSSNSSSEEK